METSPKLIYITAGRSSQLAVNTENRNSLSRVLGGPVGNTMFLTPEGSAPMEYASEAGRRASLLDGSLISDEIHFFT